MRKGSFTTTITIIGAVLLVVIIVLLLSISAKVAIFKVVKEIEAQHNTPKIENPSSNNANNNDFISQNNKNSKEITKLLGDSSSASSPIVRGKCNCYIIECCLLYYDLNSLSQSSQ